MIKGKQNLCFLFFALAIVGLPAILIFPRIDRHMLWQDEAQTALISRSILSYGIPQASDDKNSYSQELGIENGSDKIFKWHPWIPFYIHAVFFQLFGESDLVARLPDALFGIGTVALCFFVMREEGRGRRPAFIAVVLLSFTVPFLILSRQCRYYSIVAFFSVLCVWAYFRYLQSKSGARTLLIVSSVFLFYVQIVYAFIVLTAIGCHSVFHKRELIRRLIGPIIGIVLCMLPWFFYVSEISYQTRYHQTFLSLHGIKYRFMNFLISLADYVVPLSLVLLVIAIFVWHKKRFLQFWGKTRQFTSFYIIYIILSLLVLSLIAPAPFFRYLVSILPVCVLLCAEIVESGFQANTVLGISGLILFFLHQPLIDYSNELTHDFKGPMEGIVGYLHQYAKPTDTVAITYGDMPIKWYTRLRVIGGLTGEDLNGATLARWVIFRKHIICDKDAVVARYLVEHLNPKHYRRIVISAPDTRYENREDPREHLYRTDTKEDSVVIFEKIY